VLSPEREREAGGVWALVGGSHASILTAQYVKSGSGGEQGWPAALTANVAWLIISVKY